MADTNFPTWADQDVIAHARFAIRWLVSLIDDERILDLDPGDEYVNRVRQALAEIDELTKKGDA